jgi:PAS domain S-box-containing protein
MSKNLDNSIFHRIISESNTLTIILNEDFGVEYFNQRAKQLLGLDIKRDLGQNFLNLSHDWSQELDSSGLRKKLVENTVYSLPDLYIKKTDCQEIIIGITIRKIEIIKNKILLIAAGQDITRKRRDEAAHRTGERLKAVGELASGIAHDLSSPLQFVENNLYYIDDALSQDFEIDKNELREAVSETIKGIEQIKSLTTALKSFIYPSNSVIEYCNIKQIVTDALSMSKNEWEKTAEIVVTIPDNLLNIHSYPSDITRVLINLFINSTQAIENSGSVNGQIKITASTFQQSVLLQISDNGPGVPINLRERIFEPFFTTKPKGIGSGQGLAIAQSIIVGKCGGNIRYRENTPSGSIFELIIPDKGV